MPTPQARLPLPFLPLPCLSLLSVPVYYSCLPATIPFPTPSPLFPAFPLSPTTLPASSSLLHMYVCVDDGQGFGMGRRRRLKNTLPACLAGGRKDPTFTTLLEGGRKCSTGKEGREGGRRFDAQHYLLCPMPCPIACLLYVFSSIFISLLSLLLFSCSPSVPLTHYVPAPSLPPLWVTGRELSGASGRTQTLSSPPLSLSLLKNFKQHAPSCCCQHPPLSFLTGQFCICHLGVEEEEHLLSSSYAKTLNANSNGTWNSEPLPATCFFLLSNSDPMTETSSPILSFYFCGINIFTCIHKTFYFHFV